MKKIVSFILVCILALAMPEMSLSHSGRTDKNGGHKDNKNASGLGGYHYHCGGHPPHLHTNGCPYSGSKSSKSSSSSGSKSSSSSSSSQSKSNSTQKKSTSKSVPKTTPEPTPKIIYAKRIDAVDVPEKINCGDACTLKATVYPSNAEDNTITWSSDNPDIASVSENGNFKAHKPGKVVITAATQRGTAKKFTVIVNEVLAESIEIKNSVSKIEVKDSINLTAEIFPANTTDKTIEWSSENEEVAKVSKTGTVTGIGVGKTVITAKNKNAVDTFEITVEPVKAKSVRIISPFENEQIQKIKVGETILFKAEIKPADTMDKSLKWSVSDNELASIDDKGMLRAVKPGVVCVKVTTSNGLNAEMEIEVYSNVVPFVVASGFMGILAVGVIAFIKKKSNNEKQEMMDKE